MQILDNKIRERVIELN